MADGHCMTRPHENGGHNRTLVGHVTRIYIDIAGLYPVRPIRLLSRSTYLGTGQLKTFATFYLARGPVLKTESQFGLIRLRDYVIT